MNGGAKFVLRGGRAFVVDESDRPPDLPPHRAVVECSRIREYLRKRWGFDDSVSVADMVITLLEATETTDLPFIKEEE